MRKYHETKIGEGAWEINSRTKTLFFEEHCINTIHLLLYSSFSLKQT